MYKISMLEAAITAKQSCKITRPLDFCGTENGQIEAVVSSRNSTMYYTIDIMLYDRCVKIGIRR